MRPLKFDQILYNEPIFWIEKKWGRKLSDHEKNLVVLTYRYTRTLQEAEEIKILEHVDKPGDNVDKGGKTCLCVICAGSRIVNVI